MFEHKSPKINMKIRNPESSGVRDDKIHIVGGLYSVLGQSLTCSCRTHSKEHSGMACHTFLLVLKHGVFYNKFSQTLLRHSKPV
jgi:hypothetical protein